MGGDREGGEGSSGNLLRTRGFAGCRGFTPLNCDYSALVGGGGAGAVGGPLGGGVVQIAP